VRHLDGEGSIDNRHKYLERKVAAPWRIAAEQRERFVEILSEAPAEIELDVGPGDAYAQIFAADLRALFTDAGWAVGFGGTQFGILDSTVYGIRVVLNLHIDSDEDQKAGARFRCGRSRCGDRGLP
jgi:hypothetical protein